MKKQFKTPCLICGKKLAPTSKKYHMAHIHGEPISQIPEPEVYPPAFTVILIPFEDEVKGYLMNGKELVQVKLLQVRS